MKYCKRCVQPDTRPGISFNKEGVCPACLFADQHENIDWEERCRELEKIAELGRRHNVSGYDCVVGVSGGKDSTRQAMYIRDELSLKPLLVSCTYPPEQLTERGAHNLANLISLGFDCITVSPDPVVWKTLMRQGFLKFGNWCKSTEMALYASAPKVAIAYHIPLVFLGENTAISLGDSLTGSVTGDANRMKYGNTIEGGNPDRLLVEGISEQDVHLYRYPSDRDMELCQLKIYYLGYYIKDFNKVRNAEFSVEHGLEMRSEPPEDIGDILGSTALDDDFVIMNQMFKQLKLGFGAVTDQVCEAVRLGMISREEAIDQVKKYDGKCAPKYVKKFCDYIEIDEEEFWRVADKYRNKDVWEKGEDGEWRIKIPFDSSAMLEPSRETR